MTRPSLLLPCLLSLAGCGVDQTRPTYQTSRGAISQACPATPDPALFAHGLCVCEDFESTGDLVVRAQASGARARVGVNGRTDLVGSVEVDGSLVAFDGLSAVGDVVVTEGLSTTSSLEGVGILRVGGDLDVGGDLSGVGELTVAGTLRVAGTFESAGNQSIGGLGTYSPPEKPCACGKADRLDVAAEVAKARGAHDNEALGLPALDLLGEANLKLVTGRYYFGGAHTLGDTTIEIFGAVAIYVDGDLESVGTQNLTLAPGATLDLYVAGNVELVGDTSFGGEPGRFRLYVGGGFPVAVAVGNQTLRGSLYVPEAEVSFVGDTRIEGALFAKRLSGVGTLDLRQAGLAAPPPGTCGEPGEPVPSAPDAGTPAIVN
ncbi:MAG: DUF7305 domain-containing protein [Myxococcaceae bacterium]